MKILLVSDTHGDTQLLKQVISSEKDIDIVLHAGDSELPPYMIQDVLTVKGNCDFYEYHAFRNLNIEGYNIHIEHGNKIKIQDSLFLENNDYDIVVFGHTHTVKVLKSVNGNKFFFNPGSLTRPRDNEKGSYIILEISKNNISYEIKRIEIN